MQSKKPSLVCVEDYERNAIETLDKNCLAFFKNGADEEHTLHDNILAFKRYLILPHVLRNVSRCDLSTTVLGHHVSMPVCVSPTACHQLAHYEGEIGSARAAAAVGTLFTLSMASNASIEEVSEKASEGVRWFQLVFLRDRSIMVDMIRRAEKCCYHGFVLTVDIPIPGKRRDQERVVFRLPPHIRLGNMQFEGRYSNENWNAQLDSGATWRDVLWLKSITHLPIIIKGILTKEDALKAVEVGVSAIQVSNHGGRQLDNVPSSLDALQKIVQAVKNRCEVYMDGGVRTGSDVFKALALGAKAVFVGRPIIYGLAYDGENGARQVLEILGEELKITMTLTGCRSVAEINPDCIVAKHEYLSHL